MNDRGPEKKRVDWPLIGHNVRFLRSVQSLTQVELARAARVSPTTIVSVEQGRAVRSGTLLRLCEALRVSPSEIAVRRALNIKTPGRSFVLHRPGDSEWSAYSDRRGAVPEDNVGRIQRPEERRRLGRLGFVPAFGTGPSFVMPEGPGVLIDEVYGTYEFPTDVYRDYVLCVISGDVRVLLSPGGVVEMAQGDMLGVSDDVALLVEPACTLGPKDEPPRIMWIGANRKGRLSV